jgi:hypothetical protein
MRATRSQSRAALSQVAETREAVSRQLQPYVLIHERNSEVLDDEYGLFYFLRNEGLGPALNIEHGVAIAGRTWVWSGEVGKEPPSGSPRFRAVPAGETLPQGPLVREGPDLVPTTKFRLAIVRDEASPSEIPEREYWCRFDNLFGERWETRNSSDPVKEQEIRRLDRE